MGSDSEWSGVDEADVRPCRSLLFLNGGLFEDVLCKRREIVNDKLNTNQKHAWLQGERALLRRLHSHCKDADAEADGLKTSNVNIPNKADDLKLGLKQGLKQALKQGVREDTKQQVKHVFQRGLQEHKKLALKQGLRRAPQERVVLAKSEIEDHVQNLAKDKDQSQSKGQGQGKDRSQDQDKSDEQGQENSQGQGQDKSQGQGQDKSQGQRQEKSQGQGQDKSQGQEYVMAIGRFQGWLLDGVSTCINANCLSKTILPNLITPLDSGVSGFGSKYASHSKRKIARRHKQSNKKARTKLNEGQHEVGSGSSSENENSVTQCDSGTDQPSFTSCEMCRKPHDGGYGSGRFCSRSCACSYSNHFRRFGDSAGRNRS
ncbi:hypothetical protein AAMO2058_001659000 [Amorphochlora amoebiformis]